MKASSADEDPEDHQAWLEKLRAQLEAWLDQVWETMSDQASAQAQWAQAWRQQAEQSPSQPALEQQAQPQGHGRDPRDVAARDRVEVAHEDRVVVHGAAGPLEQRVDAPQAGVLAARRQPGRQVQPDQADPRLPDRRQLQEAPRAARPVPCMSAKRLAARSARTT